MYQKQEADGGFAYDPAAGDLKISRYRPELSEDTWTQAALTVEGKIANLDLVYAGSYLERDVDTESDYSDYSYFYDVIYGYVMYNDDGDLTDPSQYIQGKDRYERQSHELRIATPGDNRLRFVGGLFYQRQEHGIEQRYKIDDDDERLRGHRLGRHRLADRAEAHRRRLCRVRRVELRHHRQAHPARRTALLRGRQFAEGLLRLRSGLQRQRQQRRGSLPGRIGSGAR